MFKEPFPVLTVAQIRAFTESGHILNFPRWPTATHCDHKTVVLLAGSTAAHKGHQEEEGPHCDDDHRQQETRGGPMGDSLIQDEVGPYAHSNQSHRTGL